VPSYFSAFKLHNRWGFALKYHIQKWHNCSVSVSGDKLSNLQRVCVCERERGFVSELWCSENVKHHSRI